MCLAADIPLIESGTAGYLGQVTVIKKVRGVSLLSLAILDNREGVFGDRVTVHLLIAQTVIASSE